jgi:plasmid stabilization system protein ParE
VRVQWSRGANQDLLESAEWYDKEEPGTGRRFVLAIDAAIVRILAGPDSFAIINDDGVRSCPVSKFPFEVRYRIDVEIVRILIIKHERRHPESRIRCGSLVRTSSC